MAEVRLEQHPAVQEEDLADIYSFISKDNVDAAGRLVDAAIKTFSFVARVPESGVRYQTRNFKLRGLRMIPVNGFQNYLVFYRVSAECVRILYVVHGARDLVRFLAERPRV